MLKYVEESYQKQYVTWKLYLELAVVELRSGLPLAVLNARILMAIVKLVFLTS